MALDIRLKRQEFNLSQAQLSEILDWNQAKLSKLELLKEALCEADERQILTAFEFIKEGKIVVRRKKRISKEKFSESVIDKYPRRSYEKTLGNADYIQALHHLENEFIKDHSQGPTAISFFAGCGGLCYGIAAAGFNIVAANELEENYRNIYKLNFPDACFLTNDIRNITVSEVNELKKKYTDIDLFAGGPPCQGFSLAGKRDISDDRNTLFQYYLHIAELIRPKVILMENVRLLTSMKLPDGNFVKDNVLDTFKDIGYEGRFFIVNAKNYGVPQNRERVIFIGIRGDLKKMPDIPEPLFGDGDIFSEKYRTFGDAVSDLEYIESGEESKTDIYHRAVKHPEHVIRWLYDVPQGKSAHDNKELGMRPPSGYNTTYKRQVWNDAGCTVTTNFGMISGCNNVHPIATRALTIREALRLQSFPDSFRLMGKDGDIRTVIGNAVPPLLAYEIAKFIKVNYNLSKA